MSWYTREEAEPAEEFGTIPENRTAEELLEKGFVVVDKPFGPTSNQVSTWVRKSLDRKKTGHFGTLDPNATGVLPVGLDAGTRVQDALANASKEYVLEAKLEEERDFADVEEKLRKMEGTNKQLPPEKSAVKREVRERELMEAELLEVEGKRMLARVETESGFYVRVLVEELGEALGTSAEMEELRRTRQGAIEEGEAEKLQDVVDAYEFFRQGESKEELVDILRPIEHAVQHLPKLVLKDSAVNAVANGADVMSVGISKLQDGISENNMVAVTTLKGELVALAKARASSEEIYEEEVEAAELSSVHMDPESYPRRWKN